MIRGIVEARKPRIKPAIDRCIGRAVGYSIRPGSVVLFKGYEAVVKCVNFTYYAFDTFQVPGSRQVKSVDLGYPYDNVGLDQVEVIKY